MTPVFGKRRALQSEWHRSAGADAVHSFVQVNSSHHQAIRRAGDNLVVTARVKGRALPPVVTQGAAIDPDKEYTLAVSDFTAANMSAPSQLGVSGLEFGKDGPLLRDVILDWVRRQKVLQ